MHEVTICVHEQTTMLWQRALSKTTATTPATSARCKRAARELEWIRSTASPRLLAQHSSSTSSPASTPCLHTASIEQAGHELSEEEQVDELSDNDDDLLSAGPMIGRRLWDNKAVYPAGVKKWDNTANCEAALHYNCPCGQQCLSKVGGVVRLYEHRRQLRARIGLNHGSGQMRDILRAKLAEHYDVGLRSFSASFVVAGVSGICERAYAVAAGVSEATFVRARGDVTLNRPTHAGRVQLKVKRMTSARSQLDSWVRAQQNTMEGDKTPGLKWYTEKVTEKQLWQRYVKGCDKAQVSNQVSLLSHTHPTHPLSHSPL